MGFAVSLAVVLASCTMTLWEAMSAGRAETKEIRFGWLAAEFVTFIFALGAAAFASIAIASPSVNALAFVVLFIVWTAVGFSVAGLLVYLEYARRGRRDSFGPDLRGSLWVGRFGIDRPFGGRPHHGKRLN